MKERVPSLADNYGRRGREHLTRLPYAVINTMIDDGGVSSRINRRVI